jgi:hypothetical protein
MNTAKMIGKQMKKDFGYWAPLAVPISMVFGVMGVASYHQLVQNPDSAIYKKNGYYGETGKNQHWISKENKDEEFKLFPKFNIKMI